MGVVDRERGLTMSMMMMSLCDVVSHADRPIQHRRLKTSNPRNG